MTATDELRRLLDERGIEYYPKSADTTIWTASDGICYVMADADLIDGCLELFIRPVTPAQAVEATLGRGTCHITVEDNLAETEGMGDVWLECSACHWQMPLEPTTPLFGYCPPLFSYCPNCGRKVVDA